MNDSIKFSQEFRNEKNQPDEVEKKLKNLSYFPKVANN